MIPGPIRSADVPQRQASLSFAPSTRLFLPQGGQEWGCRAEEGELCRGCHHIKKKKKTYSNLEHTAAWCQSNLMQGCRKVTQRRVNWTPFRGRPDFSRGLFSSLFSHISFLFLKCHQEEKTAPQSLGASLSTGGLVSQIFLRTYPFLPLQGDSCGVRFPPPLTQIGNVTHLRGKTRAAPSRHRWRNLVNNWIQTGTLNIKKFLADTEGVRVNDTSEIRRKRTRRRLRCPPIKGNQWVHSEWSREATLLPAALMIIKGKRRSDDIPCLNQSTRGSFTTPMSSAKKSTRAQTNSSGATVRSVRAQHVTHVLTQQPETGRPVMCG